jgi:sugar/nucleoside kinase (ribokinase family)
MKPLGSVDVVGNAVADVLVETPYFPPGSDREFSSTSLVLVGGAARLDVGGNGARLAVTLARLGVQVRLHTSLGDDQLGKWLTGELAEAGVDLHARRSGQTATNVVATNVGGGRLSMFFPGAAPPMTPPEGGRPGLVALATCPFPRGGAFDGWLAYAAAHGACTLVDIGPPIGGERRPGELCGLAATGSCLTMNEAELAQLTGTASVWAGLAALRAHGFANAVIKLGAHGAAVLDGPTGPAVLASTEGLDLGGTSTVGAGDVFNAGLAYGLLGGLGLAEAAVLGNRVCRRVLAGHPVDAGDIPEMLAHVGNEIEQVQEV